LTIIEAHLPLTVTIIPIIIPSTITTTTNNTITNLILINRIIITIIQRQAAAPLPQIVLLITIPWVLIRRAATAAAAIRAVYLL
jgi:hypothetical protein